MSIVKVQNKGQVTIPASLRIQIGLLEGDLVEALVEKGSIVLTPKSLVDRIREITPAPPALKSIRQDAKQKETDKLTARQINAEISAVRQKQNNP